MKPAASLKDSRSLSKSGERQGALQAYRPGSRTDTRRGDRKDVRGTSMATAGRRGDLGPLLGAVAHELRNPLFMISGYSQLARERVDWGAQEQLVHDLVAIEEAAQRATEILERFLATARPRRGNRELCDINGLVVQALQDMAPDFHDHRIEVRKHLRSGLPRVLANHLELTQVFLTLFANADAAMTAAQGQGTLTVTTRLVSKQHQTWVEVQIADNGPSLAPEDREQLFEPFGSGKSGGPGLGLGLPTSHQMVTDLGGTLACEPNDQGGTTYLMRLPVLSVPSTLAMLKKPATVRIT